MCAVLDTGIVKFAAATRHSDADVCISVEVEKEGDAVPSKASVLNVTVNCDDFVLGGPLLDSLKSSLTGAP